jgi:hypothetical protein
MEEKQVRLDAFVIVREVPTRVCIDPNGGVRPTKYSGRENGVCGCKHPNHPKLWCPNEAATSVRDEDVVILPDQTTVAKRPVVHSGYRGIRCPTPPEWALPDALHRLGSEVAVRRSDPPFNAQVRSVAVTS